MLKRVNTQELPAATALKLIGRVKKQLDKLREIMRRLGNSHEHLPLNRRFAEIMAEPIDLSAGEELMELRATLMLEMDAVMTVLHREFLASPDSK